MGMRRKKNLDERLAACKGIMLYMQFQNEHANEPLSEIFRKEQDRYFNEVSRYIDC